jgi:SAM-dependent methyltransferase
MPKLNLGCGKDPKPGYINADLTEFSWVDQAFNFNKFPYPFEDDYFDEIFSDNVLEHLDDIPSVMKELHRISKADGRIQIIVPYYNCYGAFNDVTHTHYFSHLSFEPFYAEVPKANYFIEERFKLLELKLDPTRFGNLFLSDRIRLPLSFVLGQVYKTIDISLAVIK